MAFSHLFEGEGVGGVMITYKRLRQLRCFLYPLSPKKAQLSWDLPREGGEKNASVLGKR
jgi:hypothetical protein